MTTFRRLLHCIFDTVFDKHTRKSAVSSQFCGRNQFGRLFTMFCYFVICVHLVYISICLSAKTIKMRKKKNEEIQFPFPMICGAWIFHFGKPNINFPAIEKEMRTTNKQCAVYVTNGLKNWAVKMTFAYESCRNGVIGRILLNHSTFSLLLFVCFRCVRINTTFWCVHVVRVCGRHNDILTTLNELRGCVHFT